MIKRLNDELGYDHPSFPVISFPSFIWWPIVFGIVDQGRLIKEISKAEFEEQGEDYIILKTSQLAPCESTDSGSAPSPHQGHR